MLNEFHPISESKGKRSIKDGVVNYKGECPLCPVKSKLEQSLFLVWQELVKWGGNKLKGSDSLSKLTYVI